jgi:TolB-like protein
MNRESLASVMELPDMHPAPPCSDWTHAEVAVEMDRILASPQFIKSVRLSRFLRTAVQYLLEGRAESFKEYTVGTEVYDRRSGYDPTHDTIVRTEARRLRTKLHEFYARFSYPNHVTIGFNAGSYVPVIGRLPKRLAVGLGSTDGSTSEKGELRIAVSNIYAWAGNSAAQHGASEMTDDLMLSLSQQPGLTVFRSSSHRTDEGLAQVQMWKRSQVDAVIHGTVRGDADNLSASIHLATLSGRVLWAQRFDSIQSNDRFRRVCDEVVSGILSKVAPCMPDQQAHSSAEIVEFAAPPALVPSIAGSPHFGD